MSSRIVNACSQWKYTNQEQKTARNGEECYRRFPRKTRRFFPSGSYIAKRGNTTMSSARTMTTRPPVPTESVQCPLCSGAGNEANQGAGSPRSDGLRTGRATQCGRSLPPASETNTITSTSRYGLVSRPNWRRELQRSEITTETNCERSVR